jgi:hypothetical protein
MLEMGQISHRKVKITCPNCKKNQFLHLSGSFTESHNGIATILVTGGCGHQFQVFLDKNFSVRGYQKSDFITTARLSNVDNKITCLKNEKKTVSKPRKFFNVMKNYLDSDDFMESAMRFFRGISKVDSNLFSLLLESTGESGHDGCNDELEAIPVAVNQIECQDHDYNFTMEIDDRLESQSQGSPSQFNVNIEEFKLEYKKRLKEINELLVDLELDNLHGNIDPGDYEQQKKELDEIKRELDTMFTRKISVE